MCIYTMPVGANPKAASAQQPCKAQLAGRVELRSSGTMEPEASFLCPLYTVPSVTLHDALSTGSAGEAIFNDEQYVSATSSSYPRPW